MCCFSRPVKEVSGTSIFARSSDKGRQFVVYSMTIEAGEDLAMILPLPVPKNTRDDAVKFVDLKGYADFFKDMRKGFPVPPPPGRAFGRSTTAAAEKPKLKVHDVGEFEASFVPTITDFSRLDERFRLPDGVWEKLPQYNDFGFAVFKLKQGAKTVHPMAFEFPRVNPRRLFFPTVHIHDGKVHPLADFDHTLYCQQLETELESLSLYGWTESPQPAGMFMDIKKAQKLLLPDNHVYKFEIHGEKENKDQLIAVA
jgi:hypothetical protein